MLGVLFVVAAMGLLVCVVDHFEGRAQQRKMFPNNPALW